MEHSDGSPGVNDWENVQPATAQLDDDDNVMVVVRGGSVFPPNNHEGLPVTPPHSHQPQDPPADNVSSSPSEVVREGELDEGREAGGRSMARLGILSSGIVRIAHGIWKQTVCRAGFLSFTGVVAAVLAAVYGSRWIRRQRKVELDSKNQLMHLVKQKDEKIKQLLFQIARMNQILSAPRRIPVLRVVVNSSHIVIP